LKNWRGVLVLIEVPGVSQAVDASAVLHRIKARGVQGCGSS